MRLIIKSIIAITVSLIITCNANATKVIHVATWLPPGHTMNKNLWPTWGKWIEEATEGRVKIKIEYGMGNPKSLFDAVEDGVAEAGFSFHGYVPGRFKLPQIVEIPGLNMNAEAASVALWRIQNKYFTQANEFEGLTLIGMFTHGPGYIQTVDPITSIKQLEGKKIRIGGGVQSELGHRFGITPIAAPGSKVYELLQQGVIDGVFMPMGEQKSLRLNEVVPNVLQVPGGMYLGSFSIFMNPDFLAGLSKQDRQAILAVSGEKLSALAGKLWDEEDAIGTNYAKNNGTKIIFGNTDGPVAQHFKQLTNGMAEQWIESVEDRDVDAKAALADLKQIAQQYSQ